MSRRARAATFAALALVCAALAATAAGGYRGGVEAQLGELRPVLVAGAEIEARRPLRMRDAKELLEVRRVPARFAPVGALAEPLQAVGREALAPLPAGSYVTASALRLPRPRGRPGSAELGEDHEAVEITVTGAEALAAGGRDPAGRSVDVVVTTEPSSGTEGRTYVAAEGVRLLALREAGPGQDAEELGGPAGPTSWVATLGARREQALRLIQAHNYAREIRLIAAG